MENDETLIKEMDNALVNLENAYFDLESIWTKFQFSDNVLLSSFVDGVMPKDNPFKHSLDEECGYVKNWVEYVRDNLKGSQFKNMEFIKEIVRDINSLPMDERKDVLKAVNSIIITE